MTQCKFITNLVLVVVVMKTHKKMENGQILKFIVDILVQSNRINHLRTLIYTGDYSEGVRTGKWVTSE